MRTELRNALLAEFIGSLFLLMAAISPIILFAEVLESHIGIALFANAIAVSWVLCALIEIFQPISGAHFNPVVTLAKTLEQKTGLKKAALYVLCQVSGGFAGISLTHLMFFEEIGGVFFVSEVHRSGFVYFAELLGTFILVFVILMLGSPKVQSKRASIIVAFLVGGMVMSTSSTMFSNPQITLARMFTNSMAGIRPLDGVVFIAMQILGSLLAYAVYKEFLKN